jgi:kumamolisin
MNFVRIGAVAIATGLAAFGSATCAKAGVLSNAAAENAPVRLAVAMRTRDAAGLAALVRAQSDPSSPLYRHFLTERRLREAFSPDARIYARALGTLRALGFTVTRTSPLRLGFDIAAPANLVERVFATRLVRVAGSGSGLAATAAMPMRIPAALRASVASVAGLEAAPVFATAYVSELGQPHERGGSPFAQLEPARGDPAPATSPEPENFYGPDGGYGPSGVNGAFGFPVKHGYTGRGVRVADILDGEISDAADVAPYLAEFGVTRTGPPTTIHVVGGGCGGEENCADSFSAALDAEAVVGSAPGVAYDLYEIPNLQDLSILDGFLTVVEEDRADVVNFSVGGCEIDLGETALELDEIAQYGAALGMTFEVVAFNGSNACGLARHTVQAPVDSPNVLAVGGSDVFTDRSGNLTRPPIVNAGSGGGSSLLFDTPAWQKGAGTNEFGRNVPDIAGPAGLNTRGPSIYFSLIGWAGGIPFIDNAPVAAALAEMAQMHGARLGLVAPAAFATYLAGKAYRDDDFHDVTHGCNRADGSPYCATSGYDFASGIGTPNFFRLAGKF